MSLPSKFILPGHLLSPKAQFKINLAKAFAHSRLSNPRNLEAHWYGLWCKIFMDLSEDHARLITLPQFVLYSIPNKLDAHDDEDLANTTIESIASMASTIPEPSAKEVIPDFAMVRIMYRHITRINTWRDIKIKYAGVPLVAEAKRHPKRLPGSQGADFVIMLDQLIVSAENDAEIQASFLFRNYPRQETVVLVACSGEWWSCRIAHKHQMVYDESIIADNDELEEEEEEEEEGLEEDTNDNEPDGGSDDELDIMSAPEGAGPFDAKELLQDKWCSYVQLGTRRSNRLFYLIHQYLEQALLDVRGTMG